MAGNGKAKRSLEFQTQHAKSVFRVFGLELQTRLSADALKFWLNLTSIGAYDFLMRLISEEATSCLGVEVRHSREHVSPG